MEYTILAYNRDGSRFYTAHCTDYENALVVYNALCYSYLFVVMQHNTGDECKIVLTYDNR